LLRSSSSSNRTVKPCKALSTLSPKTATVAENGKKMATVAVFGDKLSPKSATVWRGFKSYMARLKQKSLCA